VARGDGHELNREVRSSVTVYGYMTIRKHVERIWHGDKNGHWLEIMTTAYEAPGIVYVNAEGHNADDRLTFWFLYCLQRGAWTIMQ